MEAPATRSNEGNTKRSPISLQGSPSPRRSPPGSTSPPRRRAAARRRAWRPAWPAKVLSILVALLAAAAVLLETGGLSGPLEAWTLRGTSTPALLARAFVVRRRNAARMRAYAAQLRTDKPLAGTRVLVTGATSGLGGGIAGHLALAGASLVCPHRRPMAAGELQAAIARSATAALGEFGGPSRAPLRAEEVDVLGVGGFDLSSFASIERTAAELADAGVRVSALINNAGLVSGSGAPTEQGFERAFGVNFLGTAYWTLLLRAHGVLLPGARVVMVGSEEHRQHIIDTDTTLGAPAPHASWRDAMARYGRSKLLLSVFAHELGRRWRADIAVYDICPGPVASDIARDAPPLVASAVAFALRWAFPSAAEAALPVVALAVDAGFAAEHGAPVHHHMSEPRPAGGNASDPALGAWVWAQAQALAEARGPRD